VEEADHPKQNKRLLIAGAGGALATFDSSVSANERRYGDMPMGYHKQVAMRHDYTVQLEAGDGKHVKNTWFTAMQQMCMQQQKNCWKLSFLCGPRRSYVRRTQIERQSIAVER
jgi:hypothetical protein